MSLSCMIKQLDCSWAEVFSPACFNLKFNLFILFCLVLGIFFFLILLMFCFVFYLNSPFLFVYHCNSVTTLLYEAFNSFLNETYNCFQIRFQRKMLFYILFYFGNSCFHLLSDEDITLLMCDWNYNYQAVTPSEPFPLKLPGLWFPAF